MQLLAPLLLLVGVGVVRAQQEAFTIARNGMCITGHNQGGQYGASSNVDLEACQEYCVDDPQCTSIDFFAQGSRSQDNCYISYSRNTDADVTVNADTNCMYYEPLFPGGLAAADCEVHDLMRFPGYHTFAAINQANYDITNLVDGDTATGWAYNGCGRANDPPPYPGCPTLGDVSSHVEAAVILDAAQTVDAVTFISGQAGTAGYHLTGGTLWYTMDAVSSAVGVTWTQPSSYPGQGCFSGSNDVTVTHSTSLDECKAACVADNRCQSIDWYNDGTVCRLAYSQAANAGSYSATAQCQYYDIERAGTGNWEQATWHAVGGLDFDIPIDRGDVASNSFRVPPQPDGLLTLSMRFSPIRAIGLKLAVFETDAANSNVILAEMNLFSACAGPPPEDAMEGSQWMLVAEEAPGDTGSDDLRELELAVPADYYRVRMEWGSGTDYVEFDVPRGTSIFGDYVDPSVPISNVDTSLPMLQNGAVFCKMCSSSSAEKYGDTCWAVLPADELNRDCGCNSGGWAGHGLYYAGYDTCNTCGCRSPNAFTGPADNGQSKGGIPSQGLRMYVKSEQEWALEDLGAVIMDTSSDLSGEAPQCVGNVHNLMSPTPIHTCDGECDGECVSGDSRFMFGQNDPVQTILVDLGQERFVNRIGAEFSITDREVWDTVSFEVSIDNQDWYLFGQVGNDDGVPSITAAEAWVSAGQPIRTRYVRFHFGDHSADWGAAGSGIYKLHAQQIGGAPVEHLWPAPLVAMDVDDLGQIQVTGAAGVTGTVQGTPTIVAGPSGLLDAVQFDTGSFVQLAQGGSDGVDTDNTWTIDCYIYSPMTIQPGRWGTLTRGSVGDHQIIVKDDGQELGGYENAGRGYVGSGFQIDSLSDGWHRLTAATICDDGACATRSVVYYIDGTEVARSDYRSETDFFAIGNYQDGAQPWRGPIHHFRLYEEGFSPADLQGTDDADSQILNAPQYTMSAVSMTSRPMSVVETQRSCSNAFGDQRDSLDPVTFCASLCFEDNDCDYFSAYPVDFRHPGRCCFYSSFAPGGADEATTGGFYQITRASAVSGSGGGGSWQDVMAHIAAEGCTWDDFSARLEAVDAACCSGGDASCPGGVPTECGFFCAEKYVPLYDRCHDLLTEMVGPDQLPAFDGLVDTCLSSDADTIQSVFDELRNHPHCIYDANFIDDRDIPGGGGPPAGGGHRRTQFGGFGGHTGGNAACPLREFDDRATLVDAACDMGAGLSMPTSCSTACALELKPFWDDCHDLIARFLDDQIAEFDALHTECADKGVRAVLYMVESLDCDATPYIATTLGASPTPPIATYGEAHGETNTIPACADECDNTAGCVAFTFSVDTATTTAGACNLLSEPAVGAADPTWLVHNMVSVVQDADALYVLVDTPLSWVDARAFCAAHYYDLASVHTPTQQQAVTDLCLRSHLAGGCKIGLHDDARADTMLDLTGGSGGQTGETVYSTIPAMPSLTVTSSTPVYNNGNYYYMEYLFDSEYGSIDSHTDYWLGQTPSDTTFTFDFGGPVDLTRVKLAPKSRTDSLAPDFQLSVGGVPVSPRIHNPDAVAGSIFEFPINQVVTELTLSIWHAGGSYLGFAEIQLYQADADAAAHGKTPHYPTAWSDMTPTNMQIDRGSLPHDDTPSPFICEKRVP